MANNHDLSGNPKSARLTRSMLATPYAKKPSSAPSAKSQPSKWKPSRPRRKFRPKELSFWTSPGMEMLMDWATDSDNYEKYTNPSAQDTEDLFTEIAKKINAKYDTRWHKAVINHKINCARQSYDAARELIASAGAGKLDPKILQRRLTLVCPLYNKLHPFYTSMAARSNPSEHQTDYSGSTLGKRITSVSDDLEDDIFGSDNSFYDLQDSEGEDEQSERGESARPERPVALQRDEPGSAYTEKRQIPQDDTRTLEVTGAVNKITTMYDGMNNQQYSTEYAHYRCDYRDYEDIHIRRIQELERSHMGMFEKRTQELESTFNQRMKDLTEERAAFSARMDRERKEFLEMMERERKEFATKMDRERMEFTAKMEKEEADLKERRQEYKEEQQDFKQQMHELKQQVLAIQSERLDLTPLEDTSYTESTPCDEPLRKRSSYHRLCQSASDILNCNYRQLPAGHLIPERIEYYPDITLEVVADDTVNSNTASGDILACSSQEFRLEVEERYKDRDGRKQMGVDTPGVPAQLKKTWQHEDYYENNKKFNHGTIREGAHIANIPVALSSAEISAQIARDDGDFVGVLFDTILYERACYRLYELKKYDFPLRYDELSHDFTIAYRLCLDPKFLANRHTAAFSHLILHSKVMTPKGIRKWVLDHGGLYELFPADDTSFMDGGGEIEELDDDDFSDYDEVEQEMGPVRKNVGYNGPILSRRTQSYHNGPTSEGQGHRDGMANRYFAVYKHTQDMVAVIIAHLRKRLWHNDGSGGEIVDIRNMGVDGKGGQADKITGETTDQPILDVKGVKKYTRRFNGKRKRANYDKRMKDGATGFWRDFLPRDPPTDYSDSESEDQGNDVDILTREGVDAAIEKLTRVSLENFKGSPKRKIQWLRLQRSEVLYDSAGPNMELRLIELPTEDDDPTFYGRLTRDILNKYKKLQPPVELIERHKTLKGILEGVISSTFPGEDLKVEAYGSFVSGLLMGNSDADFCINGPNIHDHDQLNDMNYLADILRTRGKMQNVIAIPDAMVPIVKFLDPQTNMECDLNTGNNLGVINSDLIRIYTTLDERVKPFLFMIKAICKAQGINDSKAGYLSSYAITWMGIVFLQQEGASGSPTWGWSPKAVLPKLQQQPFERMREITLRLNHNTKNVVTSNTSLINSNKSDMVHCRYDNNKDGKHTGAGHVNTKSLARLVIEFFEFFSRRFNFIETTIHAGRGQIARKTNRELHQENSRLPAFRVVDPFLHHRNITGTCRGESLARVWRAFDHSYRMLSAGDLEGAMVNVE
ncbi:hypothetical protein BGX21_002792 [Mortierella sp. AD011]|nr:hypothetical protein BGX21_002792 [Mortierella sp. AD011]